mgnify:CR=1 FL=1
MDQRQDELSHWVADKLDLPTINLSMVSGDASFRRYFRARKGDESWIAMDAPPEKEDSTSFVEIAQYWSEQKIQVPQIVHVDLSKGFLLLSDMGDVQLISKLLFSSELLHSSEKEPIRFDENQGSRYYLKAMDILVQLQTIKPDPAFVLPEYNTALLQREMALFSDWLLEEKLLITLTQEEKTLLKTSYKLFEEKALEQTQVPVHRDFHSRNLMVLGDGSLGVLDFQDAVMGPITYDLVSLLRDCYVVWPDELVEKWCRAYHQKLLDHQTSLDAKLVEHDFASFKKHFDFMGIQRHLKAAGIFARLSLRDGKHAYLHDIPNTLAYIISVSGNYPELKAFHQFLITRVQPALSLLEVIGSDERPGAKS